MRSRADEDEIVFRENGPEGAKLRILRGTIVREDDHFVHLARDDGDWSIRKELVEKIRRRPGRGCRPGGGALP